MFTRTPRHFVEDIGSKLGTMFRNVANNRHGGFGLAFALTAVPVLLAIGCSFDYVQALNTHRKMQSDLDAALVASVKAVGTKDEDELKAEIANWLEAEAEQKGYYALNTDGIDIDTTNATITASVSAIVPTTFLKIAGIENVPVSVASSVAGGKTVTKTAFSMYLVLDRSGSMKDPTNQTYTTTCSNGTTCTKTYSKMEALKLAVASLSTQFDTADPDHKYVRTGAVSYNNAMQTPTSLSWGSSAVLTYVNNLSPTGNTDSSAAMQKAYDSLKANTGASSENSIHLAVNNAVLQKYIVLMTDGENNIKNADTKTKATCDSAKTKNIRIFSIAFMAPDAGQALLKYCASSTEDYFAAENTSQLVEAFKTIGETSANNLVRLTQ